MAIGRHPCTHTALMHVSRLMAATVTEIDAELHLEIAVLEELLAKDGVLLASLLGIDREVKAYLEPHDFVFGEPIKHSAG